jgi:YhgE/Pip-like protein
MSEFQSENAIPEVRAATLLKKRQIWAFPLVVGSLLIGLVTLIYFGSIVDPTGHLHGLPVLLVNQDRGAQTSGGKVNLGDEVTSAITGSPQVSTKLALDVTTLSKAETRMNNNNGYASVVIPAGFSTSVLALAAPATATTPGTPTTPLPAIELLENDRSGTLGVSLAAGVVQPAIGAVSKKIGSQLLKSTATSGQPSAAPKALLEDPVSLRLVDYRPLPAHAGLGLSAFYGALLVMMCGFLGATIINSSVDAGLGYATSEVGPWWRQRLPLSITRWQTLLAKWAVAVPVMLVFTGVLLGVAAGVLRMDAPHWGYLWLYGWFAASVVCIGTLVLFAALGGLGQLIALLVFVYIGLASSGGTIPLEALAGFYKFVANFEPLRQILSGVRAILYFHSALSAGLSRALILTSIGLVFWVVIGVVVTNWYDRRGFDRLRPEILAYTYSAVRTYKEQRQQLSTVDGPDATTSAEGP